MNDVGTPFSPGTVAEAFEHAVRRLEAAAVSNASWEARQLLAWVMPCRPSHIDANPRQILSEKQRARLQMVLSERCQRRPLAYVLGEWDFMDFRLEITKDVLVPRPETEELLEKAVKALSARQGRAAGAFTVADVGTGSGCIAIGLAKALPDAMVLAVDLSPKALAVARRNAVAHGLSQRIVFVQGDLLSHFGGQKSPLLDAVVANLPYIDEEIIEGLDPEVRFEPEMALNGGRGGLDLLRRLLPQAFAALKPGGAVFLEVGYDQAAAVADEMTLLGYEEVRVEKDFSGVGRFVAGVRPC